MAKSSLRLKELAFTDRTYQNWARLAFSDTFTFVFGASNTGKSFAVESIDFMLGGNRELPNIRERRPYDRIQLKAFLSSGESISLERALVGGNFAATLADESRILPPRHNKDDEDNLSNFLLNRLSLEGIENSRDKSGTKKPLSFRDIVRLCVVDETSIQSKISPAETGQKQFRPIEQNIFKYMLTGIDDSAMVSQIKPKDFSTGRNAQIRLLEEMLLEIDAEISDSFPDIDTLSDVMEAIQKEVDDIERQLSFARDSARNNLMRKAELALSVSRDQQRIADISIALENFSQLKHVYDSDIARLEAIEEAGFLLSLSDDGSCPHCGALPIAQVHRHAVSETEAARVAAEIEISKVRVHGAELTATIRDTEVELERTSARLLKNQAQLLNVEAELTAGAPTSDDSLQRLSEIICRRDRTRRGLDLASKKDELVAQITKLKKLRQKRVSPDIKLGLPSETANEFASEVGSILRAWGFPGDCQTFFDLADTFDIVVDGKRRKDNGKGVRAITHAAFKVGLMTFCRSRGLPHPGFLVMDSPLITYRDPIHSKGGELEADEKAIRATDLAERMLKHLGSLGDLGQIVIFDNITPPANAATYAKVEIFTNNPAEGRQGLL